MVGSCHLRLIAAGGDGRRLKAIAFRMAPDAEPRLTRETAFHPRTSALTRNVTEYRGFWLPTKFNNHGAVDEYWACREKAVVMDLSPLRKFEVVGPDAETLLQIACTRNIRKLAVGQVVELRYFGGLSMEETAQALDVSAVTVQRMRHGMPHPTHRPASPPVERSPG